MPRVRVAKLDELEVGHGTLVQAEGRSIALFRVNGAVYALDPVCPHEGGPLDEGEVEDETVYCPWHSYDFNLRTGECGVTPDLHATTFPVSVEGGEVFVDVP